MGSQTQMKKKQMAGMQASFTVINGVQYHGITESAHQYSILMVGAAILALLV